MQISAIQSISLTTKTPSATEFIPCNIGGVNVTVLESETHNRVSQMTEQVIESGSVINDHIILKPQTVTLQFEQCNVLYGKKDAFDGKTREDLATMSVSYVNEAYFEIRKVYNDLVNMWKSRTPVTLDTFHEQYYNMILSNLSGLHKAPYKGTMKFTATFTQLNLIKSDFTNIPDKEMTNKTLSKERKAGTLPYKEVTL
jgi:hypothetical protein